ncbi:MAG: GGDEF domain-containing protein [Clostridia bacterium]|nr:GGDEF domain-containing protein [Clostridia bacterium]
MLNPTNFAIDAIGLIMLLFMATNIDRENIRRGDLSDRVYLFMLISNFMLLLTDAANWLLEGHATPLCIFGSYAVDYIYFIFHPLVCLSWCCYCDLKLFEDEARLRRRLKWYLIPLLLIMMILIANLFTPTLFHISSDNFYSRDVWYLPFFLLNMTYIVYTIVITLRVMIAEKTKLSQLFDNPHVYLLLYPLFPSLCAVLQSFMASLNILWVGSAFSFLLLQFNLQNKQITTDALTGINNRNRFNNYIRYRLRNRTPKKIMFVTMFDIDSFKMINDKYGHLVGDDAICMAAKLLGKSIESSDFLARIGGDEFVVLGERDNQEAVEATMRRIRDTFDRFSLTGQKPYTLRLSLGTVMLAYGNERSIDDLISEADRTMYEEKATHHHIR